MGGRVSRCEPQGTLTMLEHHGRRIWPGQKGAHHAFHRQPLTKHEVEPGSVSLRYLQIVLSGRVRCSKERPATYLAWSGRVGDFPNLHISAKEMTTASASTGK